MLHFVSYIRIKPYRVRVFIQQDRRIYSSRMIRIKCEQLCMKNEGLGFNGIFRGSLAMIFTHCHIDYVTSISDLRS